MADHNERACPECGSLLHYSCKLDAAVERAYGVKYAKPWTPVVDLGAWERFALLLDGAGHGVVAALARNMADWERERQKRGDFGAIAATCGAQEPCDGRLQACGRRLPCPVHSAPETWQARVPADEVAGALATALRERDHAREEAANERVRLTAMERDRDEWKAVAEG